MGTDTISRIPKAAAQPGVRRESAAGQRFQGQGRGRVGEMIDDEAMEEKGGPRTPRNGGQRKNDAVLAREAAGPQSRLTVYP